MLACPGTWAAAADLPPLYAERIATAKARAAEGSHALARDAFAAARALAPDEAQRRWCELWMLEQEQAASSNYDNRERVRREVARLMAPYERDEAARDEFWAAAASVLGGSHNYTGSPELLLEVAKYWAAQPVTAAGAEAFARALTGLGRSLARFTSLPPTKGTEALALMREAIASPALASRRERTAVMLLYARALQTQRRALQLAPERVTEAYATALSAARGTLGESEARLHQANWLLRAGALGERTWPDADLVPADAAEAPLTEAEFAEVLTSIDAALATAPEQPSDPDAAVLISYLRSRRAALTAPALVVNTSEAYLPESRLSFQLTAQHVGEVELKLLRVSPEALREIAFVARAAGEVPREIARMEPERVWTVKTGVEGALGRMTSRHTWERPLAPGRYVLLARDVSGRQAAPVVRWFLVTKMQAFAQRIGGGDLEVCVFDPETDQLPTTISGKAWQGNSVHTIAGVAPGRARVPARALLAENRVALGLIGEADGQPFLIRPLHLAVPGADGAWRVHLLADRPLYQPGETAQWKLTARRLRGGELQVPARERLKLTAKVREDTELGTWEVTLNALGSAAGQLVLPATMTPGQVSFEVQRAGDASDLAIIAAFRVEHFRAPEATLVITRADAAQIRRARGGDEVELKLAARYFSGEPLPNAKITANVRFSRWANSHAFHHPGSEVGAGNFPGAIPLSAITDARGEARLRVGLPASLPAYSSVTVDAALAGGGVSAGATFDFNFLPGGCLVELAPPAQLEPRITPGQPLAYGQTATSRLHAWPNQPAAVALFVRDGRNAPIAAAGELTIEHRTWEEIWRTPEGELVTGDALRVRQRRSLHWPPRESGWQKIHAAERREKIASVPVAIDAGGRAIVACPPLAEGGYRVSFTLDGEAAERTEPAAQLELFVADAATAWLPLYTEQPLLVPTSAQPGEPVRVLALLPRENRRVLASIGGLAGSETRFERFAGNTRLIEFPWRPGYWAGAKFGVVALSGEESHRAEIDIVPLRSAHATTVEVMPLELKVRPGEKAKLRLRTTDSAGRPLASEVALSVTDAAVASLVQPGRRSMSDTFLAPEIVPTTLAVFGLKPVNVRPADSLRVVTRQELSSEMVMLSPFEVSTSGDRGYYAAATLSGSRIALNDAASGGLPATRVRGSFSYTAFWTPDVKTDARGEAIVEFSYPDNLTAWEISAAAIAAGNRFGAGKATTQTALPFQARLRLPRAVVAGDTIGLVGALIHAEPHATRAQIEFGSGNDSVLALGASAARRAVNVPGGGESLVAAEARALRQGQGTIRFTAVGESARDAMELKLPVAEDGFFQRTGVTARAAERPVTVALMLPAPLDPARTSVEVQVSPGIVPALIESLPYLVDYPYGCVEQTMSRFLPAAVVAKLLHDLKFSPAEVEQRLFTGTRLPPRSAGVGKLDDVIAASLARLASAQNPDGSFGWFAQGAADSYMTAYVVRGLNVAVAAGLRVPEGMLDKACESLGRSLAGGEPLAPQQMAWVLSALTGLPKKKLDDGARQELQQMFARVYAVRAELTPAGLALLAHSAVVLGQRDELAVLRRNLENGVVRADSEEFGATAQWGKTSSYFNGLDGAVETTALCLQALLAIDARHPLIDAAATWLLVNRQSGRWSNTRDTALTVLALHDYARARGATSAKGRYRVAIGDRVLAERSFDRDSLLNPATLVVNPELLRGGDNRITLTRLEGAAPCFLVATAKSWAQAAAAKPAGSFLSLKRDYLGIAYQPSLLGPLLPRAVALNPSEARVAPNDLVECRLVVHAQNDLEYVAVEVPKPGGCEPLNPLSGWDATLRRLAKDESETALSPSPRIGQPIYREEHPDRSVFFLPRLAAGRWEIRYRMRAVFSGDYRALPATVEAMYVPVINGNTEARRLQIHATVER